MTKTIMAVLAHPDDETFGLGGTLALYARQGVHTYYVCATRGEVGAADPEHMNGFTDTAEMRTDELKRAAKILGLKDVFFLGYRDSGMPGSEDNKHPNAQINHAVEEVAGRIVKYIRELKPEIMKSAVLEHSMRPVAEANSSRAPWRIEHRWDAQGTHRHHRRAKRRGDHRELHLASGFRTRQVRATRTKSCEFEGAIK